MVKFDRYAFLNRHFEVGRSPEARPGKRTAYKIVHGHVGFFPSPLIRSLGLVEFRADSTDRLCACTSLAGTIGLPVPPHMLSSFRLHAYLTCCCCFDLYVQSPQVSNGRDSFVQAVEARAEAG